ncbi:hypothetical protein [Streptomyces sp. NPDC059701]|uniref:hypothetical protein n=1 Tax=Streptomyces sp. NPDC059701 TaxID=3346914 RepID=UPI00367F443B
MKGPVTACLLHADYHVMAPACWTVTLEWMGRHESTPDGEQRAAYQAAVEKAALDALRPVKS